MICILIKLKSCLCNKFYTLAGITGEVIIDSNGDRVASYSLLDMNPVTSKFEVSTFWGTNIMFYSVQKTDV